MSQEKLVLEKFAASTSQTFVNVFQRGCVEALVRARSLSLSSNVFSIVRFPYNKLSAGEEGKRVCSRNWSGLALNDSSVINLFQASSLVSHLEQNLLCL